MIGDKTIRERIESHRLPQAHRDEVISELAAHLEEDYYDARSRGLTDTEAFAIARREVEDWRVLAADIRRTKSEEDEMNARTKSLRSPGMLGLAGASILWMMLQRLEARNLIWFGSGRWRCRSTGHGWPVCQFFGAVGAYLSQRARAPSECGWRSDFHGHLFCSAFSVRSLRLLWLMTEFPDSVSLRFH
jgi:hypothetical protein